MAVDLDVADRTNREVDEAVARDLLDHVRKKRERRDDVGLARSVEIELDSDLGFACLSRDSRGAAHARGIARKGPFWRAGRADVCTARRTLVTL